MNVSRPSPALSWALVVYTLVFLLTVLSFVARCSS